MTSSAWQTFLGLPPDAVPPASCRVALLPVPYDGTTSYGAGARGGPAAILAASAQVELFDLELAREPWQVGIVCLDEVEPAAAGPEALTRRVEQACREPLQRGQLLLTLGGEHTVTVGAARAAARQYGPLSFLQVDAHLDLRDTYQGSPLSHACTARRLLELGPVTCVGARVACPEELQVVQDHGLDPFWAHTLQGQPDSAWIQRVIDRLGPQVYVTVDVDGLDPSVVPATGTPVPGGLGWYPLLALLREVGRQRQVVACDVVELAPIPGQPASDFAAAQLAYKMVGYFTR